MHCAVRLGTIRVDDAVVDEGDGVDHRPNLPSERVLAAVGVPVTAGVALLPVGAGRDVAFPSLVFAFVALLVLAVRRIEGPGRRGWVLIAAGQVIVAAGEALWAVYAVTERDPFPSPADLLFLTGFLVTAGGAAMLDRRPLAGDGATLLDTAIATVSGGSLVWAFAVAPVIGLADASVLERGVSAAYPTIDLVLLAVVLRFTIGPGSASNRANPALWLLAGSFSATMIADIGWAAVELDGRARNLSWQDPVWLLGYLLLAMAALQKSAPMLGERSSDGNDAIEVPTRARLMALIAAALALPATLLLIHGTDLDAARLTLLIGTLATFTLVAARLWSMVSLAAQLSRQQSEAMFRALAVHASDVILTVRDRTIFHANDAIKRVLGIDHDDVIGADPLTLFHPDDRHLVERLLDRSTHEPVALTVRAGDGRHVDVLVSDKTDDPLIAATVVTLRDVTARVDAAEHLRRAALHDPLTGLANRLLAIDRLDHALAQRTDTTKLAVMFVDLDDFKTVNDGLGHEAGDRVLIVVAERIRGVLRAGDTAARLGGDEFAIILEQLSSVNEAKAVGTRLRQAINQPISLHGRSVRVGGSLGIAFAGADSTSASLMREADTAMYAAKSAGGHAEQVFVPAMQAQAVRRLELARELPVALERDEFMLAYQPIVELPSGELSSLEALVRWQHPERGLLQPLEFIPFAEESGFVVALGQWVVEEAGRAARQLAKAFGRPIRINVNVSARQFGVSGFVANLRRVAAANDLEPSTLGIELTESMLMSDPEAAIRTLNALHELGSTLLLDDFGTGYCSLAYLHRFPVDVLKIDRAFVSELETVPARGSFVEAIVGLARAQSLKVVAEGVETKVVEGKLVELGVTSAQGWLYGRPESVADIVAAWCPPQQVRDLDATTI